MSKDEIKAITDMVADKTLFSTKEVLTSAEAARYMGISMSFLYKLTMSREIPHYKPTGKLVYFNRKEVEEWLQRRRVSTDAEMEAKARAYCDKNGRKGRRA